MFRPPEPDLAVIPIPEVGFLHLHMVCTREAGTVGAMIPDRICCPA